MVYCSKCWLNNAMRISNLVLNFFGMGMIIYSLCLLKMWRAGIAEAGFAPSSSPKPWFIYTFLAIGIVACVSALIGHMVSNCIETSALPIYILFITSIIFLQILAVVEFLFKMEWQKVTTGYLDGKDGEFKNTLRFHLLMCRLIGVAVLLSQASVLVLAIALWALGPESRNHCRCGPAAPEFTYSFLVDGSDSPPALPASLPPFLRRFQV